MTDIQTTPTRALPMPAVEACAMAIHGDQRRPRAVRMNAEPTEHQSWVLEKADAPIMCPLFWGHGPGGGYWTSKPREAGHFACAEAAERYGERHITAGGFGPFRVAFQLRD